MNPSDNNSFGMPNAAGGQGMMAQPVAPRDTGDILLSGSEKKGGKKWLYAVLGVVVVVILVAFGAWMITKGDGENGGNFRDKFNVLANYVLYGSYDDSAIVSNDDGAVGESFFVNSQTTVSEQEETYVKTDELLSSAKIAYGNIDNDVAISEENAEKIRAMLDNENELLKFMRAIYTKNVPTAGEIINAYMNGGDTNAIFGVLFDRYDASENDNQYIEDFKVALKNYVAAQIDMMDFVQANGCEGTNLACIYEKGNADLNSELSGLAREISETRGALNDMYNYSDDFVMNVLVINDFLNGSEFTEAESNNEE